MTVREQRREQRREVSGTVRISFSDPQLLQIEGRLMDVSASGFRMTHGFPSLAAGQLVEFTHLEARGQARVMWNRIVEERVETGFLVIAAG